MLTHYAGDEACCLCPRAGLAAGKKRTREEEERQRQQEKEQSKDKDNKINIHIITYIHNDAYMYVCR